MRTAAASPHGHNQYSALISKDLITGKQPKTEVKEWTGRTKTKEEFQARFKKKEPKVEPEAKMIWMGVPNVCKNAEDKSKLEA